MRIIFKKENKNLNAIFTPNWVKGNGMRRVDYQKEKKKKKKEKKKKGRLTCMA